MTDEDRQNALADVIESARLLHALRQFAGELESLATDAIKIARAEGVPQTLIAEAAALSAGRVSQIVNDGEPPAPRVEVSRRIYEMSEWPGDALRPHRAAFAGRMTYPPYPRRRGAS
ncbi:hypothetical protein [Agrococcus casei]|uniref:hypothetical protein n=1 Tax=Agrococcus casei TaxID=343512 RepID=UPI000B35C524|nr:hypothetical protein [Agrococcus casei]